MSGGSFDNLYRKDVQEAVASPYFWEMMDFLRNAAAGTEWIQPPIPAASQVLAEFAPVIAHHEALLAAIKDLEPVWERMRSVMKAAEWWQSNDWGRENFEAALADYAAGTEKTPC